MRGLACGFLRRLGSGLDLKRVRQAENGEEPHASLEDLMSTKTYQRAKGILQVQLGHGNTSVAEPAAQLSASTAGVCRDLTRLEEGGLAGGAQVLV